MTSASAPGKMILCGEHAVVYRQPAIAIPVHQIHAVATITEIQDEERNKIFIYAPDIQLSMWLHECASDNPIRKAVQLTLEAILVQNHIALKLELQSSIPIASGLGSSAATSIAIIRALSQHFGFPLAAEQQSQIAFEIEKIHHGTPSGIDNTTIAFERPVYFVHGEEPIPFEISAPLSFVIADSGVSSPTSEAVSKVRESWLQDKILYEALFDQIGILSQAAFRSIKAGQIHVLGSLLNRNQELLQSIGVSTPLLEKLIQAARMEGALGAKLSGAGLGGNVIALVTQDTSEAVQEAMRKAGAVGTIQTKVDI